VIAAHSQGTIIGAAALLLNAVPGQPDSESDGQEEATPVLSEPVALLTFGCPLRRLYARNFPAYFGFETLTTIRDQASTRWIDLWALTDPIGGRVFDEDRQPPSPGATPPGVVDRRLIDTVGLEPLDGRYPPVCGHSGFWHRDEYGESVETLQERVARPARNILGLGIEGLTRSIPDRTDLIPLRLPGRGE
jgi:hypothetical protein